MASEIELKFLKRYFNFLCWSLQLDCAVLVLQTPEIGASVATEFAHTRRTRTQTTCPSKTITSKEPKKMPPSKTKFAPSTDTHITTLFLDQDDDGGYLDVDSMLYHSKEHGFYLKRRIIQIRRGRTWETACNEEGIADTPREQRRTLTVFRPLTRQQMILLIIENLVPEEEGARKLVLNALESSIVS